MKLSTTLLFTLRAGSKANQVKIPPRSISALTIDRKTDINFRDAYLEFYPFNKCGS